MPWRERTVACSEITFFASSPRTPMWFIPNARSLLRLNSKRLLSLSQLIIQKFEAQWTKWCERQLCALYAFQSRSATSLKKDNSSPLYPKWVVLRSQCWYLSPSCLSVIALYAFWIVEYWSPLRQNVLANLWSILQRDFLFVLFGLLMKVYVPSGTFRVVFNGGLF